MRQGHYTVIIRIAALALMLAAARLLSLPAVCFAAEGDPTLRFELEAQNPISGLKQGDQITVDVTMSNEDGDEVPYDLYAVQLDIVYDSDLFTVSGEKGAGMKRPDGQKWTGSWSCGQIPGIGNQGQVRVLYTNIGGLLNSPPKLDSVSGKLVIGSFVLTAKTAAPGTESQVVLAYTETTGSDWKISGSVKGAPLALTFASIADGGGGSDSGSSGSNGGPSSGGSAGTSGGSGGTSGGGGSGASDGGNTAPEIRFSELKDVPEGHWAAGSIRYLVDRGIVSGNENKEFQPEKPVTRAEFCQMLSSAFGYAPAYGTDKTDGAGSIFLDVRVGDWYRKPVMALNEAGIVAGIGDGLFGAEQTLSRQDMAVMFYRILKDKNVSLEMTRDYGVFTDDSMIDDYARQAVWDLYCSGVISGTGANEMSPQAASTKAQAATVLTKLLKEIEERR